MGSAHVPDLIRDPLRSALTNYSDDFHTIATNGSRIRSGT